jgi:ribosome-associated protein
MTRRPAPHRGLDVHYGESDTPGAADARPSRSALKRASQEVQDLGLELARLPADRLAAIDMPERLREAIETYRRTRTHEGRRRQLQFVGRLMRDADEAALREALAAAQLGPARAAFVLHEAERWRTELIADDDALERWLAAHPDTDLQRLRSLVRAARRDTADLAPGQRQPRSCRELFRFLEPMITP